MDPVILEGSAPSFRSELDFFRLSPSDISILSSIYEPCFPTFSVQEITNPVEFHVKSNATHYLDCFNTYLYLRVHLTQHDGGTIPQADEVAPGNNFICTIFENLQISVNNQTIFDSSGFYPYHGYIKTQLGIGEALKTTQLTNQLYFDNKAPSTFASTNTSFKSRKEIAKDSKPFELIGRLNAGLFEQKRYLPFGIDLCVMLRRSMPEFALDCSVTTKKYKIHIDEAILYVKKHLINPRIVNHHMQKLNSGQRLKYPLRDTKISSFTMATGSLGNTGEQIITGVLPEVLIIGLVDSGGFSGNYNKVPFNFETFNLSYLAVTIDSGTSTYQTFNFDWKNNRFLLGYNSIFQAVQDINSSNGIDRSSYTSGNGLVVFDLASTGFLHSQKHGVIKLELRFSEPLSSSINVIIYGQYQHLLEIGGNKQVIINYG